MKFTDFEKHLRLIQEQPLVDREILLNKVSKHRIDKDSKSNLKSAKRAAVLALFYPDKTGETTFSLMLRETYKGVHSAQVSFPGGKQEVEDLDFYDTALRETYEELGIPKKDVCYIKELSEIYIPPSNFLVFPFMGYLKKSPRFFTNNEVAELIEVKLKDLMNPANQKEKTMDFSDGLKIKTQYFDLNNHVVWGATALILAEIQEIFKRVF